MPSRILGVDMMAFSLGNELQLYRENSPFVTLGRDEFDALPMEAKIHAVRRAVNICRKEARGWRNWWKDVETPKNVTELALAIADFRNYLADGRLQFRADLPKDDNLPVRYLGEPEILRLYRFVNANVPRPEILLWGATAWDFPYSFAKMLYQGHAESAGNLVIYNVHQAAGYNYHKQCEAGRAAWTEAGVSNEKRKLALAQHPIIRDLAGLEEQLAEFDAENGIEAKEDLCQA